MLFRSVDFRSFHHIGRKVIYTESITEIVHCQTVHEKFYLSSGKTVQGEIVIRADSTIYTEFDSCHTVGDSTDIDRSVIVLAQIGNRDGECLLLLSAGLTFTDNNYLVDFYIIAVFDVRYRSGSSETVF